MGMQRRILGDLERQGVPEDQHTELMHAIEALYSAGDDFSDAITTFLHDGDKKKSYYELTQVLAMCAGNVRKLLDYLDKE